MMFNSSKLTALEWKHFNTSAKLFTLFIIVNSTIIYCIATSVSVAWWILTITFIVIGLIGMSITHRAYKEARDRETKAELEYFTKCCRINEQTDRENRAREAKRKQMCANPYADEHTYLYANCQMPPKDEDGTEPKMYDPNLDR